MTIGTTANSGIWKIESKPDLYDYPLSDLFDTQSLSNDRPRPVSKKTREEGAKILLFDDRREEFGGF